MKKCKILPCFYPLFAKILRSNNIHIPLFTTINPLFTPKPTKNFPPKSQFFKYLLFPRMKISALQPFWPIQLISHNLLSGQSANRCICS